MFEIYKNFDISEEVYQYGEKVIDSLKERFEEIDKVRQPVLLLSFEFFNGAHGEVELLLQGPDEVFVAETRVQSFGQNLAHGYIFRSIPTQSEAA